MDKNEYEILEIGFSEQINKTFHFEIATADIAVTCMVDTYVQMYLGE